MKGYLSIGKVSKLKNVSIKSLRYYDEIGVFKPAYINEQTNYRYYKEEQLFLLDAITLCIELGIPLRDFQKYVDTKGNLSIQKLLFDGKEMAEKKILAMRGCIDQLQSTLARLELSTAPAFPKKYLEKRCVYALPFDEVTTSNRYNHMLLSLFVGAQRNGITASYPSGLLYECVGGKLQKFVFVNASVPKGPLPEGCRFLPAASYYFAQSDAHHIEEAPEIFQSVLGETLPPNYLLVETDILEKDLGESGKNLELELLVL